MDLVSANLMIGNKGADDHEIVRWSGAVDVELSKQGDVETIGLTKLKWESSWEINYNEPCIATRSLSHLSATYLIWVLSIKKRTHLLSVHCRAWN